VSKGHHIRCFDYVNHPYAQVRDALRKDALAAFSRATKGAASRAQSVASQLHVKIAGIEVGSDIAISVNKIEETPGDTMSSPVTRLQLKWEAAEAASLFPLMHAELSIYPLTATETQLDLSGHYDPPLGVLGSAVNAIVGHRIAEASVHRFVSEVANYLRTTTTPG
jgi:hypothetical protein